MGIVYEAESGVARPPVALKVLPGTVRLRRRASWSGSGREARSAARLHHTNIVPVFDFGEHDGVYYYAMQYIPGQGLDVVLDDVRRLRDRGPAGPGPPRSRAGR